MSGALVPLGAWVAKTRWADIPPTARRAARIEIADLVAAVFASARAPEISALLDNLALGAGPSTVLPTGARLPPAAAAFVNCAFAMAQDFDDIIWMGHTGHSAVFASLAVAQAEGSTSQELITACVIANEIAGRLGASSFLGPLNGQMWTFIHLVGAAAATASLLKLDADRAAHALAIALAQPPFALQPAFFGPTSKLLAASVPTQIGVQAAYLARAGMTGALDILEDRRGFWKVFTFQPLPEMLGGLGELWAIQTLTLKTSPACHYFQTACEAIERIFAQRRPTSIDQVRRVLVETNKLGDEVVRFAREYAGEAAPDLSPVGVSFDLGLGMAIELVAGRMTGAEAEPAWLAANAEALRAWHGKITVAHDPALTMRIVDGARAIPAGRAAIASLGIGDWLKLAGRYREHYGSSLLRSGDLGRWASVALDRWRHPADGAATGDGPLPLYFPNRVTIEFADGQTLVEQVDLPSGSLAAPTIDGVLRAKFLRECGPALGEVGAAQALATLLDAEATTVPALVATIMGRPA
ncbi:MAG: MmgE/PrpD family protein [Deltaproteobacteria bacterium]|nr:MmgE/PrpD family protein [Deltaproteobacteria bacterium]